MNDDLTARVRDQVADALVASGPVAEVDATYCADAVLAVPLIAKLLDLYEVLPAPWQLVELADYVDLSDEAFTLIRKMVGNDYAPGDAAQRDIRNLADALDAVRRAL